MSEALTGPVTAAALLVCVAAVAKLRRPGGAVEALRVLFGRRHVRTWHVRALCGVELAVAAGALVAPGRASFSVLAGLYGTFAGAGAALRAMGAECGCFGGSGPPVSAAHVAISGVLALTCAGGALWQAHGAAWVVTRPVLAVGIAGCAYGVYLAYVELPLAWGAWRAR